MNPPNPTQPDLESLVRLFFETPIELGSFAEVSPSDMPEIERGLLAHDAHMTVTVERFHGCSVDVEVLDSILDGDQYSRKILLRRQSDQKVVQYGIVRLHLKHLELPVQEEILAKETPLGRILIQHNVMRHVQLSNLWQIAPGDELATLLGTPQGDAVFGRTALIYCNGEPAVELLEIVTPN